MSSFALKLKCIQKRNIQVSLSNKWFCHVNIQYLLLSCTLQDVNKVYNNIFLSFSWNFVLLLLYTMNYITRILLFLEQIFICKPYAKLFVKSGIGVYLSCILSVPNCLEQAQTFSARSKIDLHIVLFTNFLCQSA